MGAAVSPSHAGSAAPSSSHSAPAPAWGPFHGRWLSMNCPRVGSLPRGAVPQEQAAPAWVPMGSQALPANLLRRGLLSPRGHRSWQEPAPARAPHGVTASFRNPPAPAWGHCHKLWVGICSTVGPHGLQGQPAPPRSAPWLQGNLCSGAWSTSCPPSALTWGSAELLLSHSLNLLSSWSCCCAVTFSLLKYLIPEALPLSLMGLALASGRSVLEPAGVGFIGHGEGSSSFSQKPPQQPPATKTLPGIPHADPHRQGRPHPGLHAPGSVRRVALLCFPGTSVPAVGNSQGVKSQAGSTWGREKAGPTWSSSDQARPLALARTKHNRITESQNGRGWKGPLWVI